MAGLLSRLTHKYEPSPRHGHFSASCRGRVVVWGGISEDFMTMRGKLLSIVETFDPFLEMWEQQPTTGSPPLGLCTGACSSLMDSLYSFGGIDGRKYHNSLHCLSTSVREWRELGESNPQDGPMEKRLCRMVTFNNDALALFGGYGIPRGTIQPGSSFIKNEADGSGWTNELHLFNVNKGVWSSPPTTGTRPLSCAAFSLTKIVHNRAVLFGGRSYTGRNNDVFIIDLQAMSWTKMDKPAGAPWPVERSSHAACCLNYGQEHPQLLISGGRDKDSKTLGDAWLLSVATGTWREITLPEGMPSRLGHSLTATSLAPGLTEVTMFGGCTNFDPQLSDEKKPMIADTAVLTLGCLPSSEEWGLLRVGRGRELGSLERIREKMADISSKMSLLDIRAMEERVARAQGEAGEAREGEIARSQQQIQEARQLAEEAWQRSEEDRQQAEEAQRQAEEARRQAEEARQQVEEAREREEQLQEQVRRTEQRAREAEQRAAQEEPFWVVGREEIELQDGEELGRGGWAVVRVAKFRGARVAAKCLYGEIASDYNRELFVREMNFASRVRHPNLLQFIGATLHGELVILTELMPTNVRALMKERASDSRSLSPAEVTSISLDVARALNYLHLVKPDPIIHRDISSANILLEPAPGNGWRAKVSDYGSVNFLRRLTTIGPGNPFYAAPEADTPSQQSSKMDIFSFGVLLLEMASCRFPDPSARERHIGRVRQPELVAVIRQCTSQDRDRRPSAGELLAQIEQWN